MAEQLRIANADQYRILVAYARGDDIAAIVEDTSLSQDFVAGTLTRLVTLDRGRARQLVTDYERQRRDVAAAKGLPAPPAPPAPTVLRVRPEPQRPEPVKPGSDIEQLLTAAERSGVARLKTKAERIRGLVDELREALTVTEAERRALAEVEAARKALDAANARLRQVRGSAATPESQTGAGAIGLDPKEVRAWAATNGVECGPIGRVPRPVVEQYLAATKAVA